jgi:hypothetical protein
VPGSRKFKVQGQRFKAPGFGPWKLNLGPLTVLAALSLAATGCDKQPAETVSQQADATPTVAVDRKEDAAAAPGPAAIVAEFLEALRTGNDKKATALLSRVAREETATLNGSIRPPASDTAKFTIGKVETVGEDGARVESTWTDLDSDGQPKTDEAIWVLRHEPDGWRVAGVAARVFPGEAPLLLNFEDPKDMFRKQQWVREEIRRRAEKQEKESSGLQAQGGQKGEKSVRR